MTVGDYSSVYPVGTDTRGGRKRSVVLNDYPILDFHGSGPERWKRVEVGVGVGVEPRFLSVDCLLR